MGKVSPAEVLKGAFQGWDNESEGRGELTLESRSCRIVYEQGKDDFHLEKRKMRMRRRTIVESQTLSQTSGARTSSGFGNGLRCEESRMTLKFLLSYWVVPLPSRECRREAWPGR